MRLLEYLKTDKYLPGLTDRGMRFRHADKSLYTKREFHEDNLSTLIDSMQELIDLQYKRDAQVISVEHADNEFDFYDQDGTVLIHGKKKEEGVYTISFLRL